MIVFFSWFACICAAVVHLAASETKATLVTTGVTISKLVSFFGVSNSLVTNNCMEH